MKKKEAQEISEKCKLIVKQRQKNCSVTGRWLTDVNYHHCISKGAGGVGYEWNVVALLPIEHRMVHDGDQRLITLCKNHLKIWYPNWTEEKCKYKKGYEIKDYEIRKKK